MESTVFLVIREWWEGLQYDEVMNTTVIAVFTTKLKAEQYKQELESKVKSRNDTTEYLVEEVPIDPIIKT